MQTLHISDQAAKQLQSMAAQEHMSSNDLMERLIAKYGEELAKQRELKAFFKPYQQDMTNFKFDREEANAR